MLLLKYLFKIFFLGGVKNQPVGLEVIYRQNRTRKVIIMFSEMFLVSVDR